MTDAVRCVVCGGLTSQRKAERAGGACGNTECIRTVRERERIERSKRRGSRS